MKHYNFLILLIGICMLPYTTVRAQSFERGGDKRPVLIDDINRDLLLEFNKDKSHKVPGVPVSAISTVQKEQLRILQTEKQKKLNQINNLLGEKKAQQRTLEASDKPDMKAINKLLDEQASLIGNKLKVEAVFKQQVRSILTEEQRIEFDANIH
ncbi:MAG: hypothetical protein LBG19_11620 [Prevotellaceae bacterium]|jgi:hypothetical protein|nr:hypothetical protein [Prevotellaceae bacterium]